MTVAQSDPGVKPSERRRKGEPRGADQAEAAPRKAAKLRFRTPKVSISFDGNASFEARLQVFVIQKEAADATEWHVDNATVAAGRGVTTSTVKRTFREMDGLDWTERKYDPESNGRAGGRFLLRTAHNAKGGGEGHEPGIFVAVYDLFLFARWLSIGARFTMLALIHHGRNQKRFRVQIPNLQELLTRTVDGVRKVPDEKTVRRWLKELRTKGIGGFERDEDRRAYNKCWFVFLMKVGPNIDLPSDTIRTPGASMPGPPGRRCPDPVASMPGHSYNEEKENLFSHNVCVENPAHNTLTLPSPGGGAGDLDEGDATASEVEDRGGDTNTAGPPIEEGTGADFEWRPDPLDDAEHAADILLASLPREWTRPAEASPLGKKTGGCAAGEEGGARIDDEPAGHVAPGAMPPAPLAICRPEDEEAQGKAQGPAQAGPVAEAEAGGAEPPGGSGPWSLDPGASDPDEVTAPRAAGLAFVAGETPRETTKRWLSWHRARGGEAAYPDASGEPQPELVAVYREHLRRRPDSDHGMAFLVAGETLREKYRRTAAWWDAWLIEGGIAEGEPLPEDYRGRYFFGPSDELDPRYDPTIYREAFFPPGSADPHYKGICEGETYRERDERIGAQAGPRAQAELIESHDPTASSDGDGDGDGEDEDADHARDVAPARAAMRRALGLAPEATAGLEQRLYESHLLGLMSPGQRDMFCARVTSYPRRPREPEEIAFATARWDDLDPAEQGEMWATWSEADVTAGAAP